MNRIQIINLMRQAGFNYNKAKSDKKQGNFSKDDHSLLLIWDDLHYSSTDDIEATWPKDLDFPFHKLKAEVIGEVETETSEQPIADQPDHADLKKLLRGIFSVYEKNIQGETLDEMLEGIKAYKPSLAKKVDATKGLIEIAISQSNIVEPATETVH